MLDNMESCVKFSLTTEEQHRSSYHKHYLRRLEFSLMLNNIASDLDILLTDLCQIYPFPDQASTKFKTFGKGQTSLDSSPGLGEDSAFGTLASTDSFSCEQKLRSDSVQSAHLDVFGLQEKGLQIPPYPERSESDPLSDSDPRDITFQERLTKTHPIWFLPDIGRSGAVHLLRDREPGTFIIRNSSQSNTMALSAQFPERGKPNVDHYLIQHSTRGYRVQGSLHFFLSIPNLITYYHNNLEELPCRLLLPPTIRRAKTLQELTSLSYLGQDFWTSYHFDRGSVSNLPTSSVNLHKSTSEPINITQASHFSQSNLPIARIMPSQSVQHFPTSRTNCFDSLSLGKSSHSSESFKGSAIHSENNLLVSSSGNKNTQQSHSSLEDNASSVCDKCGGSIAQDSPRFSNDSLSSSNCGTGSRQSPERHHISNNTHPRTSPKTNSNLYYTTSLDLLHIPENQYFKSSLSDKMSDYEDVWKYSTSAGVVPSVKSTEKQEGSVTVSTDDNKIPVSPSKLCQTNFDYNIQEFSQTCAGNESSDQQNVTKCENVDLPLYARSTKQKVHRVISLEDYKIKNAKRTVDMDCRSESELNNLRLTSNVQTQTSPLMKTKPQPLPPVDNDSSSTSTVLSSLKSPVYAEPFDTLNPKKQKEEKRKMRRRSAPLMCSEFRKSRGVSQTPNLETIFSPDYEDGNNVQHKSFDYVSNDGAHTDNSHRAALPPSGIRRTQSEKFRSRRDKNMNKSSPVINKQNLDKVVQKLEKLNIHQIKDNKTQIKDVSEIQKSDDMSQNNQIEVTWEDLSLHQQEAVTSTLRKFPVYNQNLANDSAHSSSEESSTMEDIICSVNPALTLQPLKFSDPTVKTNRSAMSEYDNLTNQYAAMSHKSHASTGTVFCNPWDNKLFDMLMDPNNQKLAPPMGINEKIHAWRQASFLRRKCDQNRDSLLSESTLIGDSEVETEDEGCINTPFVQIHPPSPSRSNTKIATETDIKTSIRYQNNICNSAQTNKLHAEERLNSINHDNDCDSAESDDEHVPAFPTQFNDEYPEVKTNKVKLKDPDCEVKDYICRLSQDRKTTFGCTIENFIQCTLESQESNPHHVTRNVRQFMSGIRNYLVKHGEGELEDIIERERTKLGPNKILNIDAIIERALHICVLRPLKHHIYNLFVEEYTRNGSLTTLSSNIKYARTKSATDIGLRPGVSPPNGYIMETIKQNLNKMQKAYSPLKKLEYFLCATSSIYKCVTDDSQKRTRPVPVGADDFLPMLIYVLVHCGFVAAEIEADFMWGLIQPSVLNGEGGYYLTSLSSAVLVLKNFKEMQDSQDTQHEGRLPSISDMQGFLKIAIPDELRDSIIWKTLPVRPNMTTKDVCSMIAHKFKITNPQDYGLYLLVKGEETRLVDLDCPQIIKGENLTKGLECVFAYKRNAANIAWPMSVKKL